MSTADNELTDEYAMGWDAAVKAERERIRKLAQDYNAMYRQACMRKDCRNAVHYVHFADLIEPSP